MDDLSGVETELQYSTVQAVTQANPEKQYNKGRFDHCKVGYLAELAQTTPTHTTHYLSSPECLSVGMPCEGPTRSTTVYPLSV